MHLQKLGRTGVDVSALCLGAMFFGTKTDKEASFRVLDGYVGAGGNFIDTANGYAHWIEGGYGGESETLLGEWMQQRGNRSRLFIASKVGFAYSDAERGLRAHQIEAECHKSLRRMNIDTIDLYYAHVDDRETPLEETLQAYDRLVRAGKVRFVGASNYFAWRLEQARWISEANDWVQFCCIQQRFTYLRAKPGATFGSQVMTNEELLDYCRNSGISLLAYSILLAGAYTRSDRPLPDQFADPVNEPRMAALRDVAAETGATVNQIVLKWMVQSSPSILPLIAASSETQLEENLGALKVQLSEEQMERLNKAGVE